MYAYICIYVYVYVYLYIVWGVNGRPTRARCRSPGQRWQASPSVPAGDRLGCSVAYSIYSIGGCYTCYIVYYTIVLHSVVDANFGI